MSLVVSERRRAANRANARRSTGPTSERGKNRSARNATTHGLAAARITLDGPERARLSRRVRAWSDDLRPRDALERALVARMARASILVERVGRLDDAAWAEAARRVGEVGPGEEAAVVCPDGRAMRRLIRHAPRWRRAMSLALAAFHLLRRARPELSNEATARASQVVQRLDRMFDGRPAAAHAREAARARRRQVATAGTIVEPVISPNEATATAAQEVGVASVASRSAASAAHAGREIAGRGVMGASAVAQDHDTAPTASNLQNEATAAASHQLAGLAVASRPATSPAHAAGRPTTAGGMPGEARRAGRPRPYREAG